MWINMLSMCALEGPTKWLAIAAHLMHQIGTDLLRISEKIRQEMHQGITLKLYAVTDPPQGSVIHAAQTI
jgi:hypothetical protein